MPGRGSSAPRLPSPATAVGHRWVNSNGDGPPLLLNRPLAEPLSRSAAVSMASTRGSSSAARIAPRRSARASPATVSTVRRRWARRRSGKLPWRLPGPDRAHEFGHGLVDFADHGRGERDGDLLAGVTQVAGQRMGARHDPAAGRQDARVAADVRPAPRRVAAGPRERRGDRGLGPPGRPGEPFERGRVAGLRVEVGVQHRAEVAPDRLEPVSGRGLERPRFPGRPEQVGRNGQAAADQGVEPAVLDRG